MSRRDRDPEAGGDVPGWVLVGFLVLVAAVLYGTLVVLGAV